MRTFEGELQAADGDRYAIVVSRFNELVARRLLEGAVETLKRAGAADDHVDVCWVPGAFELPLVASRLAASGRYAAVIPLGAVIQGETLHHEYINREVARGLMDAGLTSGVPVVFGVLTCQTLELALERAGGKAGNKGAEAARAAIETVSLLRQFDAGGG
ncbi:MAG: 6,7-dimethyl-8-ribityllumazine synthase [Planctomycetes bacterium]|nr:6,7-dimethyl-8-ribityllumazine synthase [Planctomycetota bacterium]